MISLNTHKQSPCGKAIASSTHSEFEWPENLVIAEEIADFTMFSDRSKNILISFWSPSQDFADQLKTVPFAELPEMKLTLNEHNWQKELALLPDSLLLKLFKDLTDIIQACFKLVKTNKVCVRLDKIQSTACPLFHVDQLEMRCMLTLKGSGTEWLANRSVRRGGLGKGSNQKVVREGAVVHQLKTNQLGLLKGERYIGNFGRGIVHRSPQVNSPSDFRWCLRLDFQ